MWKKKKITEPPRQMQIVCELSGVPLYNTGESGELPLNINYQVFRRFWTKSLI